jgi:hypothetical protein
MAEMLLDLLETIKAEEADVRRIYRGEGVGSRSRWGSRDRTKNPRYMAALVEATELIGAVYTGRIRPHYLEEALTTDDFPLLFGDILDRQILGKYQETPVTYPSYFKISPNIRDFRLVSRFFVDGADARLGRVPQYTEYPATKLTEGRYQYKVEKYGRRIPFSWESIINDDLDALKDVPDRFGRGARRTEEFFATSLFVDANGPHASVYTGPHANQIITANGAASNNPPLSPQGLRDALIVLSKMVDSEGEPIVMDTVHLVVAPGNRTTAMEIMGAQQLIIGLVGQGLNAAARTEDRLVTNNWMKLGLELHVNSYIPHVATAANGDSSWFLFADPNISRPAGEIGFLSGHRDPEIWMRLPNAVRVGGGNVGPLEGDFDDDSLQYRIRHVLGGSMLDPKATVASNGSGS